MSAVFANPIAPLAYRLTVSADSDFGENVYSVNGEDVTGVFSVPGTAISGIIEVLTEDAQVTVRLNGVADVNVSFGFPFIWNLGDQHITSIDFANYPQSGESNTSVQVVLGVV